LHNKVTTLCQKCQILPTIFHKRAKISKGVYKYDPDFVVNRELEDFTEQQKKQILERDNYKCVIVGKA